MNLALSSIIVFIALTPGLVFLKSYFSFPFSKDFISYSALADLGIAILPAFIIQYLFITFIDTFTIYKVSFEDVGKILLSPNILCFKSIQNQITKIFGYHVVIWFLSFYLGVSLRTIIRIIGLDKQYQSLRGSNEWHYILSGEILDFPTINLQHIKGIIIEKFVDILSSTDNGDYIYQGLLQDYNLSKDGKIENITLGDVKRRKIEADNHTEDSKAYYQIPGNILVFSGSSIKNINIRYVCIPGFKYSFWSKIKVIAILIFIPIILLSIISWLY